MKPGNRLIISSGANSCGTYVLTDERDAYCYYASFPVKEAFFIST